MTGQLAQESKANVLLRCEELQAHLDGTKDKLNRAAAQLEELSKILLTHTPPPISDLPRPWLEELAISQVVNDLSEAEQKLAEVRSLATELGISLPPHFA